MSTHVCVCTCSCSHVCVCAGVCAYPPVCVCTFLGSARELTGAEKTVSVTEETDIDAEEASQPATAEESDLNRGVTDLDATAKTAELKHSESKVSHPEFTCRHVARASCSIFLDGEILVVEPIKFPSNYYHSSYLCLTGALWKVG